ncbi:MAG: hypothetical protein Q8L81_05045 [Bacteroidota bacterium]|nr:hypothetical protein [Bacteroidota bacterium]
MDYFFALILYVLYKLLALLPLILILIGIIKLHRQEKSPGTQLMLIGNLGLILKIVILDSLMDYFTRFSNSFGVSDIGSIYNILHFITITFTILFAVGFLIFVTKLVKK